MKEFQDRLARLSPIKRALLRTEQLESQLDEAGRAKDEPIAVIGMSCRFPGDTDGPVAYWRLLRAGGDAITEVPADRWKLAEFYDPNPEAPGKMYSRFGGFLRGVDLFDPGFFRISPREAASMDPQQRVLLEVAWEDPRGRRHPRRAPEGEFHRRIHRSNDQRLRLAPDARVRARTA
jgi:hypothetical protein